MGSSVHDLSPGRYRWSERGFRSRRRIPRALPVPFQSDWVRPCLLEGEMTKLLLSACVFAAFASHAYAGPLHDAVKSGDVERVKVLIEQGEDVNQRARPFGTPLHQAAISGNAEMAELLLAKGADVNFNDPLLGTPLRVAAGKGDEAVTAVLIAGGADLAAGNAAGLTPLHAAAEGGHVAVVELLIENGADVNARSTRIEFFRPDYPPVHSAGLNGHFDIVDLLRAYGAKGPKIEPVAALLPAAASSAGEAVFNRDCHTCHGVEKGGAAHTGPNLWGVLGRKKASAEGFPYSTAFGRLVGIWTLAEFNAFIASPVDYVPGTKMRVGGVVEPAERANLIAFLQQHGDAPLPLPPSVARR
jgi:cytochrome c